MKNLFCSLGAVILLSACSSDTPASSELTAWPDDQNPLTEAGRERIDTFLEESGSSSALILYQGKIAYQSGDIHQRSLIHSIRKAVLGVLFGDLIEAGTVQLDEQVGDLQLAEPGVPFTPLEASATVQQLLESRSGIYLPAAAESDAMTEARPLRGAHAPGEAYSYNNWSFNALGTLYEARASQTIYEAFENQLARPLGMTSFEGRIDRLVLREADEQALPDRLFETDGFYLSEPDKSRHEAYHFRLSAHDLALFGQLLLQDGAWDGQSLVSADWIDQITECRSVTNPDIGGGMSLCYGMMWTVAVRDGRLISFSHTGSGSHLISVHPGAELVIVHRAPTEDPDFVRINAPSRLIGLTFEAFAPQQ